MISSEKFMICSDCKGTLVILGCFGSSQRLSIRYPLDLNASVVPLIYSCRTHFWQFGYMIRCGMGL